MAGELKDRINVSLQAVAQVLLVCGLGVYLAKKHGFDRKAIAAVSGVNWHVLIPALMFSSIVGAVTPQNLVLLWPMLLASLLHIVMGVVPAFALGWLARLPKDMWFFTVMASSLPNCGNLPWLFMPSIIRYYAPEQEADGQIQYCIGLVSVYTIITIVVTLTVPFLFKKPPDTLLLPRRPQHMQQQHQQDGQVTDAAQLNHTTATDHKQQAVLHTEMDTASEHDSSTDKIPTGALNNVAQHHVEQHLQQRQQLEQLPASGVNRLVVVASHSTLTDAASLQIDEEDTTAYDTAPSPYQHAAASESFVSGHSSSGLLRQGSALLSSLGRSVGRSFSRGLRRSESVVLLVWSYPLGWHKDRSAAAPHRQQEPQHDGAGIAGQRAGPRWLQVLLQWCKAFLDHPVVNVPLGATILGIVCAAVGPVRDVLVPNAAPLHWLWLGFGWVGAAAAPLATMQIGAELVQAAPVEFGMHVSKRTQWTATAIAIVVKLVLVPLINVAVIRTAGLSMLVPATDTVYQLLLLVEAAVPAAVTLLVVCGRVYPDIRPLSQMLFWQYVASMVTLPCFLVWFMYMLHL